MSCHSEFAVADVTPSTVQKPFEPMLASDPGMRKAWRRLE